MRLKSLTTLNTLLLVAVCLALGATLWWSERALERPYLLMARYLGLSQQFQHQVAENIHAYLGSGDALRHAQALQALVELEQDIGQLPGELADQQVNAQIFSSRINLYTDMRHIRFPSLSEVRAPWGAVG